MTAGAKGETRMDAYYIAEWQERYEVGYDGREAKAGGELKAKPLDYVRLAAHGRSTSAGSAALRRAAGTGQRYLNAYGVFCKLLEIAADNPRERRGWILNHRDRPATAEDIAGLTGFPLKAVTAALGHLNGTGVGWIGRAEYGEHFPIPQTSRNSAKLAEPSKSCTPSRTEPEHETKHNPNPKPNANASGSDSGKTDGKGSGGNSPEALPDFAADAFVSVLAGKLEIGQMKQGGKRQHNADLACLRKVAAHIAAGHLGDTGAALERCILAADAIAKDARDPNTPKIDRPAAVFQKRINAALEKRGHAWRDPATGTGGQ